MKYDKYKCDGCERNFNEHDDVVVCPECGTPQHRECYELKNECVNAAKHGTGFVWGKDKATDEAKGEADEKEQDKNDQKQPLVCPACGYENEPGSNKCAQCGQKFTMFGVNVLEKQQELEKEEQKYQNEHQANITEITDADSLIDARVAILAPGITYEQKAEPLCGKTIREVIGFVGRGADSYVGKFRKIERERKKTFNWAAFLLTPFWFFYRKLYKHGIVFLTVDIAITLILASPMAKFQSFIGSYTAETITAMTQAEMSKFMESYMALAIPIFIIMFVRLIISIVAGFIADRAYYKYCFKSLVEISTVGGGPLESDVVLDLFIKRSSTSLVMMLVSVLISSFLPSLLVYLFTM